MNEKAIINNLMKALKEEVNKNKLNSTIIRLYKQIIKSYKIITSK